MIKNEDVICISSIDWDFIWQGHQEIMTTLARNGNRVLFIENTGVRNPNIRDLTRIKKRFINWKKGVHGIRKIEKNLYVYSPLVLPFPYLRIARFINKRIIFSILFKWLKAVGFSEPIVWTFLPTGLTLDLIYEIEPKVLIYYCIDSFQSSSKDAKKIKRTESMVAKKADLVFTTSHELFNYCAQYNKKVYYFPFGVNIDNFTGILEKRDSAPPDIKAVKKPIAGYAGGVHKWIDFDLVRYVANANKNVSFVFCGPIQTDVGKIKDLPNVILLGQKTQNEIPAYVKEFDIALIPYRITDYTRNVYPTKLNEYLSLGKPVISIDLPEIMRFNNENSGVVKVASDKESFAGNIRQLLNQPYTEKEALFARSVAKKNSWSNKCNAMSLLIEETAYEKSKEKEVSWKRNMSRFYTQTRRKVMPFVLIACIIYWIIFYTPLLWFLASPLDIKDTPLKSDVIVALGGGVGESGKVGQGYEERVDSAVRLYDAGFAKRILYSSGYKYIMKEAEIMKALSIEMGVKSKDIMLDDKSVNTYEMIKHLKYEAAANNWGKIILISSPYHMLRLKLLCDANLKDVSIYYFPVQKSSFYAKDSRIRLGQIKGILHEYIAILYYKLKNYF